MRTLIAFFSRQFFFFMFIILEAIALVIFVNNNYYPNTRAINTANHLTGFLNTIYSSTTEYFSLKQDNERLAAENAMLHNQLDASFLITDTNTFYSRDSAYRFIPARIINNSVNRRSNYFMINKGSKHGVGPDMGVVSPEGVCGIIISVSKHYSTGMSLLHKDMKVSSKIKKNNQLANVVWDGRSFRKGILQDIPTHIQLFPGDTIITSGYSFIFPEGMPIGRIIAYEKVEGTNLNSAIMSFSTDFNSLKHVYVIENLMQDEQQELMEGLSYE
jgi:rod shape-determining protein MreC